MEESTQKLLNSWSMRPVRRAYRAINTAMDADNERPSRSDVEEWIEDNPDKEEDFRSKLRNHAASLLKDKWESYSELMHNMETEIRDADSDTIKTAAYYDSFFRFSNRNMQAFRIHREAGLIERLQEYEDENQMAQEIHQYIQEQDFDFDNDEIVSYYNQAETEVSSLIGNIDYRPYPRLIKVEDENHVYIEFWSRGDEKSRFDAVEGDYIPFVRRYRMAVRIHLDSSFLEVLGDAKSEERVEEGIEDLLRIFNGGQNAKGPDYSEISLSDDDITDIKDNLSYFSTLDDFGGNYANLRYSSNNGRNVEFEQGHEDNEQDRDYRLSHPVILAGRNDGEYGIIDLDEVLGEDNIDQEDSLKDVKDKVREEGTYSEVKHYTVKMNADKDGIRIRKQRISPEERSYILKKITDELGWADE